MNNQNVNTSATTGIQMNVTAQVEPASFRYVMPDGLVISRAEYEEWLESRRYR